MMQIYNDDDPLRRTGRTGHMLQTAVDYCCARGIVRTIVIGVGYHRYCIDIAKRLAGLLENGGIPFVLTSTSIGKEFLCSYHDPDDDPDDIIETKIKIIPNYKLDDITRGIGDPFVYLEDHYVEQSMIPTLDRL